MSLAPDVSSRRKWPSWWPVPAIVLLAALLYGPTLKVYYCSYDDLREFRRSAMEDSQDWTRTFTTSHFGSYRYRPLSRLIQLWTWEITPESPLSSRIRNVGSHLLSIAFVFGIARLMFGSIGIAAGAALLFAVKPSANQHIDGAVWPNMVSHMTQMATLYVFLRVWKGRRAVWMAVAVAVLAWLTSLQYEASLTVFVSVALYGLFDWLWKKNPAPPKRFVAAFCISSVLLVGAYMVVRRIVHGPGPSDMQLLSLKGIVSNQVALWTASTTPLDYVLLSKLIGQPLPPVTSIRHLRMLEWLVAFGMAVLAGLLVWRAQRLRRLGRLDLPQAVFLLIAVGLTFTLQSLFAHPSESYIYPASGIFSILLAYLFLGEGCLSPGGAQLRVGWGLVAVFAMLGIVSVGVRNQELAVCGTTVRNIHDGLPIEELKRGEWQVSFAAVPGQELPVPYGLYQRRGVWAIGWNEFKSTAFDMAVQLWTLNPRAHGELREASEFPTICGNGPGRLCYLVDESGRTTAWHP